MMSKIHRGPIAFVLLVGLLAGLSMVVLAEEQPPAQTEQQVVATSEVTAPRVYQMNGITIAWDQDKKAYRSPTAEEALAISREFNKWIEAQFGAGDGLMPTGRTVEVKTLDSGMLMARLPAHLLSASVVRVDENGKFVTDCADGAESTAKLLKEPVRSNRLEVK